MKQDNETLRLERMDGTLIREYIVGSTIPSRDGIWKTIAYRRLEENIGGDIEKLTYHVEKGLKIEFINKFHPNYWIISNILMQSEKSPSEKFRDFLESRKVS